MASKFTRLRRIVASASALLAGTLAASQAQAQSSVESFYKDKSINFLVGFSPGGGYDAYARIIARFLGDHIPGRPRIVLQYMPGGGGRTVSRFVYHVAPKDGSIIATADQSLLLQQALGDQSIQFDADQLNWIGNTDIDNNVLVTWYTSGVGSLDDAKAKTVQLGATSTNTTSETYPEVLNAMFGTKFKIVKGYPGGSSADIAMENGEIGGRGADSWANLKVAKPQWIREKKVNVLVQIGLSKAADLANVPLLMDLATNEKDRAALRLLSSPVQIGRPLFTAPGVPADRIAALRKAFDETMHDTEFLKQAKSLNLDVNPLSGAELQKVVADIVDTPKTDVARLASIIGVPD